MCPSESIPDLLASVKLLAAPTVDIAAASVGERSLADVVRQMEEEEERKNSDSTLTVDGLEIQAETQVPVESPVAADPAVAGTAEETKVSEEAKAPDDEEEMPAEDNEKTMVPPPKEPVGEAEPDAVLVAAQSPEKPVINEEVPPAAEEVTAAAAAEEVTAAAAAEEAEEPAAEAAQTVQLEEASTETEAEVLSAVESEPETAEDQSESCHCAPPADDPAPPAGVEGVLACEETMDSTLESEEQEAPSE